MKKWIGVYMIAALIVAANSSKIISEEIANNLYVHLFVVIAIAVLITGAIYMLCGAISGRERPKKR